MNVWIRFTADGIPSPIFFSEQPDSEAMETADLGISSPDDDKAVIEFLAQHRRVNGEWVLRDPVPPHESTPEEIAAAKRERYEAAVAARTELLRAALMADPMYLDWQMGLVERTVWAVRAMQVSASIPEPVEE